MQKADYYLSLFFFFVSIVTKTSLISCVLQELHSAFVFYFIPWDRSWVSKVSKCEQELVMKETWNWGVFPWPAAVGMEFGLIGGLDGGKGAGNHLFYCRFGPKQQHCRGLEAGWWLPEARWAEERLEQRLCWLECRYQAQVQQLGG